MEEVKVVVCGGLRNSLEKRRQKAGEKEKDALNWMQSFREEQGDKKAFLNEQCKEVEENNKIGKT